MRSLKTHSFKFLCLMAMLAAFSMVASSDARAALLLGQTVNYQYYFADLGSPYAFADNGNKLVGAGIEVADIVDGVGTLDISDTNLFVDFTSANSFIPAAFNGFVITDVFAAIPDFTSVIINAATNMVGFDASRISFDADHIYVNWQGLAFTADTIVSLDINGSVPVPEPATLIIFGAGLAGLAFAGRRRRRTA